MSEKSQRDSNEESEEKGDSIDQNEQNSESSDTQTESNAQSVSKVLNIQDQILDNDLKIDNPVQKPNRKNISSIFGQLNQINQDVDNFIFQLPSQKINQIKQPEPTKQKIEKPKSNQRLESRNKLLQDFKQSEFLLSHKNLAADPQIEQHFDNLSNDQRKKLQEQTQNISIIKNIEESDNSFQNNRQRQQSNLNQSNKKNYKQLSMKDQQIQVDFPYYQNNPDDRNQMYNFSQKFTREQNFIEKTIEKQKATLVYKYKSKQSNKLIKANNKCII